MMTAHCISLYILLVSVPFSRNYLEYERLVLFHSYNHNLVFYLIT